MEPLALRALLAALCLSPAEAARILGVAEGEVARWLSGVARIPGDERDRWDARAQRWTGPWAAVAERLCQGALAADP